MNNPVNQSRCIRRAFSAAHSSYEQAAILQREVSKRLLERLADIGKRAEWILDIGAGTGTSTRVLQKHYKNAECVALDFASPMLQELQSHDGLSLKPQMVCADAAELPFSEAKFDLVFSSLTFQWCDDLAEVFGEVKRVLAPQGLFLFATLGPDTLNELRSSWAAVDTTAHVNDFLDMHHVGDTLLHAGFSNPVVDVERIVLTHQDIDELLRDLKALGANTVVGERRRGLTGRRSMQAMHKAYEQFRTPEGDFPATFEVVYGLAWQSEDQHPLRFLPPNSFLNGHY